MLQKGFDLQNIAVPYHAKFKRILHNRIHDIVQTGVKQTDFVKNRGIHAARPLMKKHRQKYSPVYIAFLDLEDTFDHGPHELIWYALRS